MGYISFVTGKSSNVEYVKHVVLESNPLLEGNIYIYVYYL